MTVHEMDREFLDFGRAYEALHELNRQVAAMYCQPVKEARFVFVEFIHEERMLDGSGFEKVAHRVAGDCNPATGVIRLVLRPGWQATAVHELLHLYNPERDHRWIKRAIPEVVTYLKSGAWQRTALEVAA